MHGPTGMVQLPPPPSPSATHDPTLAGGPSAAIQPGPLPRPQKVPYDKHAPRLSPVLHYNLSLLLVRSLLCRFVCAAAGGSRKRTEYYSKTQVDPTLCRSPGGSPPTRPSNIPTHRQPADGLGQHRSDPAAGAPSSKKTLAFAVVRISTVVSSGVKKRTLLGILVSNTPRP